MPGLGNMGPGLAFPMSQYPSGMGQGNDCHQLGYDLSHHPHSFANSFPNHPNAHHAATTTAHGMTPFSQSEEYSKAMHSMAMGEGHHFGKAATATTGSAVAANPGTAAMIDCYAKLAVPEANNNWNHESYANANAGPYVGSSSGANPLCHGPVADYSHHQYGINIGHNF